MFCWRAAIEHCLSRWHREVGGKVWLLTDQTWLLVQHRYCPTLSKYFGAPACSCQAEAESAAADRRWRPCFPLSPLFCLCVSVEQLCILLQASLHHLIKQPSKCCLPAAWFAHICIVYGSHINTATGALQLRSVRAVAGDASLLHANHISNRSSAAARADCSRLVPSVRGLNLCC